MMDLLKGDLVASPGLRSTARVPTRVPEVIKVQTRPVTITRGCSVCLTVQEGRKETAAFATRLLKRRQGGHKSCGCKREPTIWVL